MPLRARELTSKLSNNNYRIDNAARRVAQFKVDPMRPLLEQDVDFSRVFALLEAQLG